VFARLLEPLSTALERADRGAAAIRLDLRLTTRATHTRLLQLPAPMRDPKVLRTLLLLDLESHPPSPLGGFGGTGPSLAGVDIVTIELDPAPARITQFSLLERALPSPETLSTLTARLSALVGETRVGSAVLLDSHRPDAFAMTRFAPEQGAGGATGASGANGAVLRRQRIPPAIRVSVEHGRPVYIAAARRGMPQGSVIQAAGPWRTSGGWWSGTWNRDEWDVALKSGIVCRIYQDRTTERWFLDGIYD
jgi:protein ImuB